MSNISEICPLQTFSNNYADVQSTWKWFLGRLNIVEHDALNFRLIWQHLLEEILSWTWEKFIPVCHSYFSTKYPSYM